jgi:hypothetical protein
MGIRETLSKRPALSTGVGAAIVVGMIVYTIHSLMPSDVYSKAYFTIDDGQTLFTASINQRAPFDHHGQPAYRAWVFSCDGGKTTFVGFLERCTPQAITRLDALQPDYDAGKTHIPPTPTAAETEVKKPGPGNPWVSRANYQQAQKIVNVQCPDGSSGTPEVQFP